MKKFLVPVMIIAALFALVAPVSAEYITLKFVPDTNNVVIVSGVENQDMIPVAVYQEITGTETNTAASVVIANGVTFRTAALTAVVGGAEVPQVLNRSGTNTAPYAITPGMQWKLTGSGTGYTNITYGITFEVIKRSK